MKELKINKIASRVALAILFLFPLVGQFFLIRTPRPGMMCDGFTLFGNMILGLICFIGAACCDLLIVAMILYVLINSALDKKEE